jgi:anti-sigma B factor antagonist
MTMVDFDIDLRKETDETVTVVPRGELDLMTSGYLRQELLTLEALGERRINIDLRGISYLDSAGLRVIVSTKKRLSADGRELRIISASPQVEQVLAILGLSEHIVRGA